MAVSLNSVVGFSRTVQAEYPHASRNSIRGSLLKAPEIQLKSAGFGRRIQVEKQSTLILVANDDNVLTDSSSARNVDSGTTSGGLPPEASEAANGTTTSANIEPNAPSAKPMPTMKRSPLTAREKLRAARVLSRYTEPKKSTPQLGSKLLDALRESDKGKKRPGLPEAPTNLFDDSKRGMPKPGWTFEFPGGIDVFLIAFSFVFISTVMFATTYIVWKVGAIHFNEY